MSAERTPAILCTGLTKGFGGANVLDGFDLSVPAGAILGLLGPSGSGKTTALRVIAGFERPDSGSVEIAGRVMVDDSTWVPPERRRVGMVFQDYALFPHLSVATNVGYGVPGPGQDERVAAVLELVGLGDAADRYPHELSGGEQQRVALARALAPQPDVVLLDEPFSNLDAPRRDAMRREVQVDPHRSQGDRRLRHPRPGRGARHERRRRGDARRQGPPGGRAFDALSQTVRLLGRPVPRRSRVRAGNRSRAARSRHHSARSRSPITCEDPSR